jgi:hypothetical protein
MKITLYGIPKRMWKLFAGMFSASAGLILWRLMLLITVAFLLTIAAYGSIGTVGAIVLGFIITTILSQIFADDLLAVWRNLWNAQWAEVEV